MKQYGHIIMLIAFVATNSVSAGGMRCGTKLVQTGESIYSVQDRCGHPIAVRDMGEIEIGARKVNVERHTYSMGRGKFSKLLEYHNGTLVSIENGPRM